MYSRAICTLLQLFSNVCNSKDEGQHDTRLNTTGINSTCCVGVGCFSTAYPFTSQVRHLNLLPKCPEDIDIKFIVFSRRSVNAGRVVRPGNKKSLEKSDFNSSRPTKVIIHGFIEDTNKGKWMHEMKRAFLSRGDFNVILVDWGKGAQPPYGQATANTRAVGAELALLIGFLQVNGAAPETFHIVGHSLGSHIAGYAGERLQYLGRITGLDPADPYFTDTDKKVRLDPSDALLVDVIHTDGDHILSSISLDGGFGMADPIGHMDFYPNGGEEQPGCDMSSIVKSGVYDGGKRFVACDHLRAHDYFTESINSKCPFTAYPCDTYGEYKNGLCGTCGPDGCASMGFLADKNVPKLPTKYYLDTSDRSPFCRYHFQVKVSVVNDGRRKYGKIYVTLHGRNKSTDELLLTPTDIFIQPGAVYRFPVSWHKNIGPLDTVDLRWTNTVTLSRLGYWFMFRTPSVYFKEITVAPGDQTHSVSFCPTVTPVDSERIETFHRCS